MRRPGVQWRNRTKLANIKWPALVGLSWAAETGPQGLARPGRPGRRGAPGCVLGFERPPWTL
jgi:hypothetical protein